jgi:UDP-N-acetylmuramoylalanine--D-glutamate ligase
VRTLREFRGLAHRMAQVAEVRGVVYINDSKSTTVASTIAALEGMRRKSVLIAGGDAKGQDFIALVPAVRNHARAVVLLGRDAPLLERALRATGVDLLPAAGIEEAVALAAKIARPGDAVLLSPACASWDMFRDYSERGDRFASAVRAMPMEADSHA